MSLLEAPSAAVRTMRPPSLTFSFLRMSSAAWRSSSSSRRRTPSAFACGTNRRSGGQRDLRREARALRLHAVLDRLHEDRLSPADRSWIFRPLGLARISGPDLVYVGKPFFSRPISTKAASMPGSTFVRTWPE